MCESLREKPASWKPPKFGKVRNVNHERKIRQRKHSQPKREDPGATSKNAIVMERHRADNWPRTPSACPLGRTALKVCLPEFWACFGSRGLSPPVYTLWKGKAYLLPLNVRCV